jgi:hypothetical protein
MLVEGWSEFNIVARKFIKLSIEKKSEIETVMVQRKDLLSKGFPLGRKYGFKLHSSSPLHTDQSRSWLYFKTSMYELKH